MSLQRSLVAHCDRCPATVELNPQTAQPWRDLSEMGWGNEVVNTDDDIKVYCPKHPHPEATAE